MGGRVLSRVGDATRADLKVYGEVDGCSRWHLLVIHLPACFSFPYRITFCEWDQQKGSTPGFLEIWVGVHVSTCVLFALLPRMRDVCLVFLWDRYGTGGVVLLLFRVSNVVLVKMTLNTYCSVVHCEKGPTTVIPNRSCSVNKKNAFTANEGALTRQFVKREATIHLGRMPR